MSQWNLDPGLRWSYLNNVNVPYVAYFRNNNKTIEYNKTWPFRIHIKSSQLGLTMRATNDKHRSRKFHRIAGIITCHRRMWSSLLSFMVDHIVVHSDPVKICWPNWPSVGEVIDSGTSYYYQGDFGVRFFTILDHLPLLASRRRVS